nr:hypothetical protein [Actinomyces sp. B33]
MFINDEGVGLRIEVERRFGDGRHIDDEAGSALSRESRRIAERPEGDLVLNEDDFRAMGRRLQARHRIGIGALSDDDRVLAGFINQDVGGPGGDSDDVPDEGDVDTVAFEGSLLLAADLVISDSRCQRHPSAHTCSGGRLIRPFPSRPLRGPGRHEGFSRLRMPRHSDDDVLIDRSYD